VADFIDRRSLFKLRVLEQETFYESGMDRYVNIFVDRTRNQEPAMLPGIRWQICASSA